MRIFHRAPIFLPACALWLHACTTTTPGTSPVEGTEPVAPPPTVVADSPEEQAMYDLLVGEFAGQRGLLDVSAEYYLEAASETRDARIAERAVQIALAAEDHAAGLRAVRLLAELRPGDLEVQQLMVLVMLRGEHPEEALVPLRSIVENTPGGPGRGALVASALLSRERDKAVALGLMRSLAEHYPSLPEIHYGVAGLALPSGEFEAGLRAVDRSLTLRPGWSQAIILRSRLLRRQGRQAQARAYLQRMVDDAPNDSSLRLHYARMLLDRGDYAGALTQFEAMERLEPENPELILTLGVLYLQEQRPAKAKAEFRKLLRIGRQEADANYYLGQIAEAEKRPRQALEYYRAVDEGSNRLNARVRTAVLLADQGKLEEALRYLEEVEAADTATRVRLYLLHGELLRDHGHPARALGLYTHALGELPDDSDLLYARAMVAEQLGRLGMLERDLGRIIAMEPDNAQALNALGYTLADRTDRLDEALTYIQRALKLRPNDYYILDSMGWVQYRLGNYPLALDYLRRALAAKPDPEVAAHLGEVLWVMDRREEARAVWLRGLRLAPDSRLIREAMQRLQGRPASSPNGG